VWLQAIVGKAIEMLKVTDEHAVSVLRTTLAGHIMGSVAKQEGWTVGDITRGRILGADDGEIMIGNITKPCPTCGHKALVGECAD